MKIYLATWTEQSQGDSLTRAGATSRLLSYYFLLGGWEKVIKRYVLTGRMPDKETKEASE